MPRLFRAAWLPTSTLLLALTAGGSWLLPRTAHAYGFTGQFAPGSWNLNSYLGATQGAVSTVAPTESLGYNSGSSPNYECVNSPYASPVNCVSLDNLAQGIATLVGSDSLSNVDGHGSTGERWATQWEMTYSDPAPAAFAFDWTLFNDDLSSTDQAYYYIIDDSNNATYFSLGSSPGSGIKPVNLQNGWKLGFGIFTNGNGGGPAVLEIRNFDAAPVPGPLPALGAVAAFGWSRRLRSRIRRRAGSVTAD